MKLFKYMKDGGPLSKVWGLFIIEIKSVFSIVLLRFKNGSREAFHSHAFNAVSWVLKGELFEQCVDGTIENYYPSFKPVWTARNRFHKVTSIGETWVITFRGPWEETWKEYLPNENKFVTLTHGRKLLKYNAIY